MGRSVGASIALVLGLVLWPSLSAQGADADAERSRTVFLAVGVCPMVLCPIFMAGVDLSGNASIVFQATSFLSGDSEYGSRHSSASLSGRFYLWKLYLDLGVAQGNHRYRDGLDAEYRFQSVGGFGAFGVEWGRHESPFFGLQIVNRYMPRRKDSVRVSVYDDGDEDYADDAKRFHDEEGESGGGLIGYVGIAI